MTSEWVLDQNGHSVYVPIQSENFGPRRAQFYLEQHEDSKHEALRPNHPTKGARANRLMFAVQVCVLRFSGLTCMLAYLPLVKRNCANSGNLSIKSRARSMKAEIDQVVEVDPRSTSSQSKTRKKTGVEV